jgi:restriction system protein
LVWVLLYAGLGWRFWTRGVRWGNPIDLWLLLFSIALGVGVVVGWRAVWPGLRSRWRLLNRHALSLDEMQALTPSAFEAYVGERLFTRKGYHVHNTRDVKDGGIDLLVTDRIGQRAVVQCKRYRGTVGEPAVRDLYGTMVRSGAIYAYMVTTGTISNEARAWAAGQPLSLIDGQQLADLVRVG